MTRVDEIIHAETEDALVGVVMKLTGGSANPSVVRGQADCWKRRLTLRPEQAPTEIPAYVREAARDVWDDLPLTDEDQSVEAIARAIVRAVETERERCRQIASEYDSLAAEMIG